MQAQTAEGHGTAETIDETRVIEHPRTVVEQTEVSEATRLVSEVPDLFFGFRTVGCIVLSQNGPAR
jgi:hypothetical protein